MDHKNEEAQRESSSPAPAVPATAPSGGGAWPQAPRGRAKMAKTCIGLDLGSSSVKVAHLGVGRRGGDVKLLAFGIEPIAPDAIVDGTIMNQSAVVDAVRALMSRLKLKQKDVALAISGHSVIIKKILVPAMTDEELEEQIPWEAEQHIPFDKND